MCLQIIYLIYIQKQDLGLFNQQWLIRHKTQTKPKLKIYMIIPFTYTKTAIQRLVFNIFGNWMNTVGCFHVFTSL